jgi:hypothetical protein
LVPDPLQLRTRTANRFTPLATPNAAPPTVPETCVPWPLQSMPLRPSPTASKATRARRPNVVCVTRMPVSMM